MTARPVATDKKSSTQINEFVAIRHDSDSSAVMVHDLDGNILYANDAVLQDMGYSRKRFLGMNIRQINDSANVRRIGERMMALTGSEPRTFETTHLRADGVSMPVEIRARLVRYRGQRAVASFVRRLDEEGRERAQEPSAEPPEPTVFLLDIDDDDDELNELRLEVEHHRALGDMWRLAHECESLPVFVERALDRLTGQDQDELWGSLAVHQIKPGARALNLVAQRGMRPEIATRCASIPFGTCLCGRTAMSGVAHISQHVDDRHEIRYEGMSDHGHYVLPIRRGELTVGVVAAVVPAGHELERRASTQLLAFCEALRVVIDQERTLDEMRTLSTAFEQSHDWVVVTDGQGIIQHVNQAVTRISGYTQRELIGQNLRIFRSGAHDAAFYQRMWATINAGEVWRAPIENQRKDGSRFQLDMSITPVHTDDGRLMRFVSTGKDVTQERSHSDALERQTYFDKLTGLPNRQAFVDKLNQEMARSRRHSRMVAMIVTDIDRFKMLNDTLGHDVCDALLLGMSKRLRVATRAGDIVARLGTDEFGIGLTDVGRPEDVTRVLASLVRQAASEPYKVSGREVLAPVSVGVSVFPDDGADPEAILENAYAAQSQAEKAGGSCYKYFEKSMNRRANEFVSLQQRLGQALERGEFVMHYQPAVCTQTGSVTSMEGLVRWRQESGKLLPPARFIPYLEESGMIDGVEDRVLALICAQIKLWEKQGLREVPIAMNLSAVHFRTPDLVDWLQRTLTDADVKPARIILEVTESAVVENPDEVRRTLERLKELGLKISIDDFGTGYSSLSYLTWLPVDQLKVDMSFVQRLEEGNDVSHIVRAIIEMAHALNLDVVAEGVETPAQLKILRELDCDRVQGYFVSRPLNASRVANWMSGQPN